MWQFGVSSTDITPSLSCDLAGGAFGAPSSVMHPLQAQALYIDHPMQRMLIISCDLLGFDSAIADRIRQHIARATGIPTFAIMLACTHTHGGPATMSLRSWGQINRDYLDLLAEKLTRLAQAATGEIQTGHLHFGIAAHEPFTRNRTFPDQGPTDDSVHALHLTDAAGRSRAVLVHASCHPVNLHSGGVITPDFVAYVRKQLQAELGADVPVLFLLGSCGDLLPLNFEHKPDAQAAEQTAARIVATARSAMQQARPMAPDAATAVELEIAADLAPLPDLETLEQIMVDQQAMLDAMTDPGPTNWESCKAQALIAWASEAIEARRAHRVRDRLHLTLQGLRLGDLAMVGVPGELFCEPGLAIQKSALIKHVMVVTQANGAWGYFPTTGAFEKNSYEAIHCPRYIGLYCYQPNVADGVREGALDVLRQLRYGHHNPRTRDLWQRSSRVIVGGGQAHKRPTAYVARGGAAFATHAKGAYFWDADGRRYLDYLMAYGPIVLGHCHPEFNERIRAQLDKGTIYSCEHQAEIDLAEQLCDLIPCSEQVMYYVGGTSATTAAVRVARAFTGREKIIRCGYHGWVDWCFPRDIGAAKHERELILDFPYNNAQALADLLVRHHGQIAGVIIEALQDDGPSADYFQQVRALCDEHGVVFILDEVKTGFRFHLRGAQHLFGINPDLAVFGKAMCNGFPGAVLVGRHHIMRERTDTYTSATFHGDALSMVAGLAVIDILRRERGIEHMHALGTQLINGLNQAFAQTGLPCQMAGFAAMPAIRDTSESHPDRPIPREWRGKAFREFCAAMQRRGFFVNGHVWFLSLAHTAADIESTICAARDASAQALDVLHAENPVSSRP